MPLIVNVAFPAVPPRNLNKPPGLIVKAPLAAVEASLKSIEPPDSPLTALPLNCEVSEASCRGGVGECYHSPITSSISISN